MGRLHPQMGKPRGIVNASPSTSELDVVPLTPELHPAYLRFAAREFGADSYQGREGYLRWLYAQAPIGGGVPPRAMVAVVDGHVVGCFHKMRLPWSLGDETVLVTSPHNLLVSVAHRTGVGFALISETFKRESHLLLLGAGAAVDKIYERLGARAIPTYWHRSVLNPITLPVVFALHRAAPRVLDALLARTCAGVNGGLSGGKVDVRAHADGGVADEVIGLLRHTAGTRAHVRWTAETLRWRFFDPAGPRHLLVRLGAAKREPSALAIVSIGIHRSVCVARTVEWYARDTAAALAIGLALRALLTALGANAWMAMTSDAQASKQWRRAGLWRLAKAPATLELHRPRALTFGAACFGGGAGDSGFEALPLDAP